MSSMNELKAKFDANIAGLRASYAELAGEKPGSWYKECVTEDLQEEHKRLVAAVPRSFRGRGNRGGKKKTTTTEQ
jgi:hypothetical protein